MKLTSLTKLTTPQLTLVWAVQTQSTTLQGGDIEVSFDDGEPVFSDEFGSGYVPSPLWQIPTLKLSVSLVDDGIQEVWWVSSRCGKTVRDPSLEVAVMRVSVELHSFGGTFAIPESEAELEGLIK